MIFDVEADGLLDEATKIHVLAYRTKEGIKHTHDYEEMRTLLLNAKVLIGHNIVCYDIPVLERILNIKIKARLIDTLALSWYLEHKRNVHGLEKWGEEFGVPKPEIDDWENLSPEEYAHRCREDVKINFKLWTKLKKKLLSIYKGKKEADRLLNYLTFKMQCAALQEDSKWKLDKELAQSTLESLKELETEKINTLKLHMPKVVKYAEKSRPPKPYKKDGTVSVAGAKWFALLKKEGLPKTYTGTIKVVAKEEEPNPGSHVQVKDWLFSLGWEPATFKFDKDSDGNEKQIPQVRVDGEEGKELCPSVKLLIEKEPAIEVLDGLTVIQHRISIFEGYLKNEKGGYLVASVGGLTNTLRFKHRVLVNLPGVHKPFGVEIRGSLIARKGFELCGSDMVSLEETTKKHYMWPYDPEFVKEMSRVGFDAHLDLAVHAGAVTQEEVDGYIAGKKEYAYVKAVRKIYKAANYACIYGVGAAKLARETGLTVAKAKKLIEAYWKRNWSVRKLSEDTLVKKVGNEMWLFNPVSKLWYSLRNEKDIFSTLNQGTGVFCFDSWLRQVIRRRKQITGQFHDEGIWEIRQGHRFDMAAVLISSINSVNDSLKLNVKLGVDIQFGDNYAQIH